MSDRVYLCPTCGQYKAREEFSDNETCKSCYAKWLGKRFLKICPPLYAETDPSRLPSSQYGRVMGWNYGPRGLLLAGESGKGKTRCAWDLVKRLMTVNALDVVVFDCVGFGHEMVRRYRSDDGDIEDWLDELAKCPLIFFDDFGKDKATERVEAEIFGIVERRVANKLPIIATTNDTGESLISKLSDNHRGQALIRRLRDFCQVITF